MGACVSFTSSAARPWPSLCSPEELTSFPESAPPASVLPPKEEGDAGMASMLETSSVRASYMFCFARAMSRDAPFPNASSMEASFFTRDTRMGTRESPSRSRSPLAKAAALIATRPSSEE